MDAQRYVAGSPAPWSGRDTLLGVGLALAGALVLLAVGALASRAGVLSGVARTLVVVGLLEMLLLAVVLSFTVKKRRLSWRALGFRRGGMGVHLGLPLLVLLASISLSGLVVLLARALGLEVLMPPETPDLLRGAMPVQYAAVIGVVVFLAPLAEEVFFRGFVLQGLLPSLGPWGAVIASAALFSVSHGAVGLLIPALILGLLLGWLFLRAGSIWACVTAHAFQNALALSLAR